MNAEEQVLVTIDKWLVTHFVLENDASAPDLCHRLDQLIKTEVAEACTGLLPHSVDPGDPSIWLIQQFDFDLNLAVDRGLVERAVSHWGEQMVAAIQNKIVGEEDDSVICFPDRPTYLAHFVRDFSVSRAWGKCLYQEFESLRPLSTSRAVCEALTDDPKYTGRTLIKLMALQGLHQVLDALTPDDAERIFSAWQSRAGETRASTDRTWAEKLLSYSSETPLRSMTRDDHPFRDGLWWAVLAATRDSDAETGADMFASAEALLRLRAVLSALPSGARAEVLGQLAGNDLAAAQRLVAEERVADPFQSLEFFAHQMQGDLHWANQAEGSLLGEHDYLKRFANPRLIRHGPAIPSQFAGVFRLGPSFLSSGCHDILAACDPESASLFRHLIAVKCLGGIRACFSADDTALRTFSGFSGRSLEPTQLQHQQLRIALTKRKLAPGRSTTPRMAECIFNNVVIVKDIVADEWVQGSVVSSPDDAFAWASAARYAGLLIEFWRGERPEQFSDDSWSVVDQDPKVADRIAAGFNQSAHRVHRLLQLAADDFIYFSLVEAFPWMPTDLDLDLTILTRSVMKHFQRRVIGLELSSPGHVYGNTLVGTGFVHDSCEQLEIDLPLPPLSVVLRLSGVLEETYVLPWIEGREICLRSLTD